MSRSRPQFEAVVLALAVVATGAGVAHVTDRRAVTTELATDAPALDGVGDLSGRRLARPTALPEGVRAAHEAGVTGAGVTVGVVDATGFDVDHPALSQRVREARSFGGDVENGGANDHGTAAALTVAAVAPDADLLLANAASPPAAARAVRWLARTGADVVVVPVNELGAADTGEGRLATAAQAATARGAVVVVPTGNYAAGHWEGPLHPTPLARQTFGPSTRLWLRRPLGSARRAGGAVRLWMSWNGTGYPRDLTLDLYRAGPDGPRRVASSERVRSGTVYSERLATTVRPGDLFVTIRFENRTVRRFDPLPVTVELTATTHRLSDPVSAGSVAAPATAPAAVSVGAYDVAAGRVAEFSGRGPTADGRRGVDLVASPAVWPGEDGGTSAAAAHTAGVAALVADAAPGSTARRQARTLQRTAVDVDAPGPDPVSGHGRLDPAAAVSAATDGRNDSETAPSRASPTRARTLLHSPQP